MDKTEEEFSILHGIRRSQCKECKNAYARNWRKKNADHANKKAREWRNNNKERHAGNDRTYYLKNQDKLKDGFRKYYENNKDRIKAYQRKYRIESFGISIDDYDKLFLLQDGLCAICGEESKQSLAVDHDHITGAVRGLLCFPCNTMLGKYEKYITKIEGYLGDPPMNYLAREFRK